MSQIEEISRVLYANTYMLREESDRLAKEIFNLVKIEAAEKHKQHIRGLESTLAQRNQTIQQLSEALEGAKQGTNGIEWYRQGWADALVTGYSETVHKHQKAYEERYG